MDKKRPIAFRVIVTGSPFSANIWEMADGDVQMVFYNNENAFAQVQVDAKGHQYQRPAILHEVLTRTDDFIEFVLDLPRPIDQREGTT